MKAKDYMYVTDLDVYEAACEAVNALLPATIWMKVNGTWVARNTLDQAYITENGVFVNLEPIKDMPNRVATRHMRWTKPRD